MTEGLGRCECLYAQLCVEGTDDGCCCKGRGTWKVYARFETLQEARSLWGGLRQPESWDKENLCIGAAAGGLPLPLPKQSILQQQRSSQWPIR